MKLYTFIDENGKIIVQIKAENLQDAIDHCGPHNIDHNTDFYSETY